MINVTVRIQPKVETVSVQYYWVVHDTHRLDYGYKSRTAENWSGVGPQTPEVLQCMSAPKENAGDVRTNVSGWSGFFDALNDYDERKIAYLKADNTALFNLQGFPQYESVLMGGNIVTLDEIRDGWGHVHTMDVNDPIPSVAEVNFAKRPDLVHVFTIVTWRSAEKMTAWVNTPKGRIYYPLISKAPIWLRMEYLIPIKPPFPDPLEEYV